MPQRIPALVQHAHDQHAFVLLHVEYDVEAVRVTLNIGASRSALRPSVGRSARSPKRWRRPFK